MTQEQFDKIIEKLDEIILLLRASNISKPKPYTYSYPTYEIKKEQPPEIPNVNE